MGLLVNSIPSSRYQTHGVSKVAQVTNHNGKKKTGMFSILLKVLTRTASSKLHLKIHFLTYWFIP